MLRAKAVLGLAGLAPGTPIQRLDSARNEVWLAGDVVVRVATSMQSTRLSHEAVILRVMPPEVPHPRLICTGRADFGEWSVMERMPGTTLSRMWPDMPQWQRRHAIHRLGTALQRLHRIDASELRPSFQSADSLECPHQLPVARLNRCIERARALPGMDAGLMRAIEQMASSAPEVLGTEPSTLVHGDFHLENVLAFEGGVRALIDFEFSRPGWPEIDLEVLLRFCEAPELHASADYARRIERQDFRPVVSWLHDAYPELFSHPRVIERVNLCSLAYDVRDLLLSPPDRPAADLAPFHPVNRLQRLIDGRGLLQLVHW
ncbi:MAG: aminoglycoside phosphotransferase [Acidimicrobiia bacterium]|nr:aminoglycoside phosphotransferase [Acidimicrobiia bacterium]